MMKIKVKVGSLNFEQGTFQAGNVIEVDEERAKLFDPSDVEVLGKTIVVTPTLNSEKTPTPAVQNTATFTEKPTPINAPTFIEKQRRASKKK